MVRKLIDPELLLTVEQQIDFDIWDDLPKSRVLFEKGMREKNRNAPLLSYVPFQDHEIDGLGDDPPVLVRVYRPDSLVESAPAMLWMHGGGYVLGTIDIEVPMMQWIAEEIGCVVVAVEYRLAPEHPFPAALNDCYAALEFLFGCAEELRVDTDRIAIAGASAGAGLAASLALMARERGHFQPLFQLLLCPMLDDRNELPSTHFPLKGISWSRGDNRKGWDAYLGGRDPAALPGFAVPARAADLSGLPPAYIAVASLDLFLDEDLVYARRLMMAEVPTELHVFPGGIHGFEFNVPGARVSKRAHALKFDILRQAFGLD